MCLSGRCSTTGTTAWTCVAAASQAPGNRRRAFRSATLVRRAQAAGIALPGHLVRRLGHGQAAGNALCSRGRTACSLGTSLNAADGYTCVDTLSSNATCGGCSRGADLADPSAPAGVDCSALPGVDEVQCANGRCRISAFVSCSPC